MLICGDCSARNNDGERFCSNCGAYLVWQRTPAEAEEQRPMPARSSTSRGSGGPDVTTAQLPIVPGPPDTRPAASPVNASGTYGTPPRPADRSRWATWRAPPVWGSRERRRHGDRGRRDTGAALEERQPGKEGGHVPHEAAPHPPHNEPPQFPGGLICRRCGAGNKPDVNFCRQCGASLKEAAPAPPHSAVVAADPQPHEASRAAGRNPAQMAETAALPRGGRFAPHGVGAICRRRLPWPGGDHRGRDCAAWTKSGRHHSRPEPKKRRAPKPGRGAELAFDGSVRSWASEGPAQRRRSTILEAGFSTPLRLTYVVITSVASGGDHDPATERRPVKVEIVAFRANGAPCVPHR